MILIMDSTTLIAFYVEMKEKEVLHDITKHGYRILVPKSVFSEIQKKDETFNPLNEGIQKQIVELINDCEDREKQNMKNRYPYLHDGEIEVILYGMNFKKKDAPYYCITDDKRARKTLEKLGIPFHGVIGLLKILEKDKVISEKKRKEMLKKLHSSTFWI